MPITKMHFQHAAGMVAAIRLGTWTYELPDWASDTPGVYLDSIEVSSAERGDLDRDYIRAVWTAEAFIMLFSHFSPRFNQTRFLKACGFEVSND